MKKILLICFLLLITQNFAFADEIIDSQGNIIPCKIETVEEGLIEYYKDGNLYSFIREEDSPVFNDYVDVKLNLLKKEDVARVSGKIILKDMWGVIIKNQDGKIHIPWYKVQFIGIYRP